MSTNQNYKIVGRTHKLPSIFCDFDWVRKAPGSFGNALEDPEANAKFKSILEGKEDVSDMDDHGSFTLALELHTSVLSKTGNSGNNASYYWNLWDVDYLLNGTKPPSAVPISDAGFTAEQLATLAKDDSYLEYIRAYEDSLGKPKGHYFPISLEAKINAREKRLAPVRKLNKLRSGLKEEKSTKRQSGATSNIPETLRNKILQFHGYACIFDGRTRPEVDLHVHHVIPRKLIQRLSLPERLFLDRENLVCACSGCNIAKGDDVAPADVAEYLKQFRDPSHPNHPILKFVEKIKILQSEE